ncbi:hypothetical protein ACFQ4C_12110 [Larkinella insperata]|uniref:Uncharacterized protein n=1 Tax=Larkinella insperata TaxID=332158 RepID=A0ABW3QA63_9BACT|nr:hypothetical protein [Larkinella insperata]
MSRSNSTVLFLTVKEWISLFAGAILAVLGTYFYDQWKAPQEQVERDKFAAKIDSTNIHLQNNNQQVGTSNQQLSRIIVELQSHSTLISDQTKAITTGISDLEMAYRSPTIDTTNIAKIINNILDEVRNITSTSNAISEKANTSKSIAEIYENQLKLPNNLERLVLPRGSKIIQSKPIDGQYYVGVQGEFRSGQSTGVYGVFDGRTKNMLSGDTAIIHTGSGGILKVTLERIDETSYIFGVNHLKK